MTQYQYIQPVVDKIINNYITHTCIYHKKPFSSLDEICEGYTAEQLEKLESLLPKGRKIPLAVKEWLSFTGNWTPGAEEGYSFENLSSLYLLNQDYYQGFEDNIKKMLQDYFPVFHKGDNEQNFELEIVAYAKGDNPPVFHWYQNFDGRVELFDETFNPRLKTFTDRLLFGISPHK